MQLQVTYLERVRLDVEALKCHVLYVQVTQNVFGGWSEQTIYLPQCTRMPFVALAIWSFVWFHYHNNSVINFGVVIWNALKWANGAGKSKQARKLLFLCNRHAHAELW